MNLTPEQGDLARNAKRGKIRSDIMDEFDEILKGKRSNPAHDLVPIVIIDSDYDGPEDRRDVIRMNPEKKENIFAAYLMKRFPGGFGLYLFSCFLSSDLHGKEKAKWMKDAERIIELCYNRKP